MQSMLGNTLVLDRLAAMPDTPVINRKDQSPSFSSLLNGATDEIINDDPDNKASVEKTEDNDTEVVETSFKKGPDPLLQEPVNPLLGTVALPMSDIGETAPIRIESDSYQPPISAAKPKEAQKKAAGKDSLSEGMIGFVAPKEASPYPLSISPNSIGHPDKSVESSNHLEITPPISSQSDNGHFLNPKDLPERPQPNGIKATDHLGLGEQSGIISSKEENLSISDIKGSAILNAKASSSDQIAEPYQSGKTNSKAEKDPNAYKKAATLDQTRDKGVKDVQSLELSRSPIAPHASKTTPSDLKDTPQPAIVNLKATAVHDHTIKDESLSFDASTKIESADHVVLMNNSSGEATNFHHNEQKNRNAVLDSLPGTAKGEMVSSRAEIIQMRPFMENNKIELNHPVEINTQSVIDKILAAKQSMNNTSGRIRIILDPPNLGPVNLDITVRKEFVDVVMTTENTGVQQALQSRADDIRLALQRQDFRIENFQVLLHQNTANHQQSYSGNTFGHTGDKHEGHNQRAGDMTVKPLLGRTIAGPIQGLVSVFV